MSGDPGRLGAIVLAGGRSSRFGRDKLAEPMADGRSLLHHAIGAVGALGAGIDVVVVAAPGTDRRLPAGVRLAHDPVAFGGPLAGLAAGLAALDADVDRVLVVAGDMPSLRPAVLGLVDATVLGGADAAVLEDPSDPRPFMFPIAVRRAAAVALVDRELAAGTRRFGVVADGLSAQVIPAAAWMALDPAGATPRDIDVDADLGGAAPSPRRPRR